MQAKLEPFIQVEQTAFRVHRFFFERDSPYFHRLLNPAIPGDEKKGTSDLDPLVIDDVPLEEFEMFLWIFYNPCVRIVGGDSP